MGPHNFDSIRTSSKRKDFNAQTHLFPIDEAEEFYDPFSDLNLFLAKKVKDELLSQTPQEWSRRIQHNVLQNILPEFRKQFPQYRLGINALKKTWEKVLHYIRIVQKEEGLSTNGHLNIEYMIRENLRPFFLKATSDEFHPYNSTHQLAVKISECIATIDGVKCEIDVLAKQIWLNQRHLLVKNELPKKTPFEQIDSLDKLLIRFQTEEIVRNPHIAAKNLKDALIRRIERLKQLDRIICPEDLRPSLSIYLSEKLYPSLRLHKILSKKERIAIQCYVQKQFDKAQCRGLLQKEQDLEQLKNRLLFLYQLSARMNKTAAKQQIYAALEYVYSMSTNTFTPKGPVLQEFAYKFIDKELQLVKEHRIQDPLQYLLGLLMEIYDEAVDLPSISVREQEELEIFIWKILQERQKLTRKVPHYLHSLLQEELGNIHMDHAFMRFDQIVEITIQHIKKIRMLNLDGLQEKAVLWASQNDLIYSWIELDSTLPLVTIAKKHCQLQPYAIDSPQFAEQLYQQALKEYPRLEKWAKVLQERCHIIHKYFYYNTRTEKRETPYDRFLLWHYTQLTNIQQPEFQELVFEKLKERVAEFTPLLPFDSAYCRKLFVDRDSSIAS